jgi:hypothetical protein
MAAHQPTWPKRTAEMKTPTTLLISLLAVLSISPPVLAEEDLTLDPNGPVRRIRVVGADSDMYYVADCVDRRRGSVVARRDPPEVCATPQDGEEKCLPAWRIVDAAVYACS